MTDAAYLKDAFAMTPLDEFGHLVVGIDGKAVSGGYDITVHLRNGTTLKKASPAQWKEIHHWYHHQVAKCAKSEFLEWLKT